MRWIAARFEAHIGLMSASPFACLFSRSDWSDTLHRKENRVRETLVWGREILLWTLDSAIIKTAHSQMANRRGSVLAKWKGVAAGQRTSTTGYWARCRPGAHGQTLVRLCRKTPRARFETFN